MPAETKNMIKKQITAVIVAAVLLIAVTVVYFAVIKPLDESNSAVTEEAETLLPGEEPGAADRFYMYTHVEREDMSSIEVTNGYGTFKMIADGNGSFCIEGYEDIAVDGTKLSSLVTTCGATLTKARVTDNATDEKLAEYGLKEPSAHWTVTDKAGKQYKVYVGRALLTGGGYYCRFAGRDSVYVLDVTLADTVLCPVENYVVPYIIFGVSKDDYFTVDDFTVYKGREKVISISNVPTDEIKNPGALAESVVSYPAPYAPDPENYYGILLSYAALIGDETYKLGPTDETLAECGLNDPTYTVSFNYKGNNFYFFLKDDGEGNYYAISNLYSGIISKISKRNLAYPEYDLLKWLHRYVFRRNIVTVSSISVKTDNVDETFYLSHGTDGNGNATLQVRSENGLEIKSDESVLSFRNFYGHLVEIAINGYLPEEASEGVPMKDFVADEGNRTMTVEIKTLAGETLTYEFYRYTTRRCALGVNGRFDFSALYDDARRIEQDVERLLAGEFIEAHN